MLINFEVEGYVIKRYNNKIREFNSQRSEIKFETRVKINNYSEYFILQVPPFKEESEFIPFIHTEDISIHEKISSATNDVVLYIATLNIYSLSFPLKKMPRGRYSIFGATK